jgi:sulfur carrier protein
MKITLNNRTLEVKAEELTVQELITSSNFTFKFLVTKINGKLIRKEDRAITRIKEGDRVDVIHLISGG